MLRSVEIECYRGFRRFELHDLGRVNLIVGTNNSGKTSVLEAVHLLTGSGDISVLWHTLARRGEDVEDAEDRLGRRGVDVRRLFHGHDASVGCRFTIAGETDGGEGVSVVADVLEARPGGPLDDDNMDEEAGTGTGTTSAPEPPARTPQICLSWSGKTADILATSMSGRGVVPALSFSRLRRARQRTNVRFITAASLSPAAVVELFEEVVLTPDEELVLEALRIIEPSIERIASVGGAEGRKGQTPGARGGLLLRCAGIAERIPIGSMGDGIWRLLGLALALARTENGLLLVDEIDTGLHYTVMEDMWKLVSQTAKRLNTQVFATTHSRDCYESLAAVCSKSDPGRGEVTIQRIERGRTRSTAYTEQEIIAAADRQLGGPLSMAKPHPKKLLVEGDDDKRIIPEFMEHFIPWGEGDLRPVQIESCGGVGPLLAPGVFGAHLKEPGLRALGVIVDADDDPASRWARLRDRAREDFPAIPDDLPAGGLVTANPDGLSFGVWMMPDNASRGMMETFLALFVPGGSAPLWDFVLAHCDEAKASRGAPYRDVHLDKARIHAWLALQDPPGYQLHQAVMRTLRPGSPHADPFVKWFRELYSL